MIPKYQGIFNNKTYKHIILTSGRAGTKSSYAAIRANYQIVSDGHGSVVVLRKHHNKLRKTVYKEILRGINRLKIPKSKFRITKSPMEITYKKYGTTIYFAGSDGIDDTKGIIDEDKPIKLVILDELTEFFDDGEGEDELTNIEATFVRGNSSGFQMIYLYNPPKNPNAPINQWCKKMEKRKDCIHIHTDYRDVPVSWLGQDLIGTAEEMKIADLKMYRWVWLGEAVGIDDAIYYMFSQSHIREPEKGQKFSVIAIGGDYGQQNATTFQAAGLDMAGRKLRGLGEYYHSGRESGHQKSPSIYARDFVSFVMELGEKYGSPIVKFYLYMDPSAKGLQEEIKRACRLAGVPVLIRDAENDVKLGISRTQKALTFHVMSISPKQERAIDEFGTYEYDKDSIEKGKEEPIKTGDHCMDAIRYLVMGEWSKIKHWLPVKED
ncbi:PBSX family phage terminase large subunit [Lachnospiraceae bacterium]|nr:PBSX family phage terminase large subunit [Ruminococcus sp.]NBI60877.1 PBSX family phage terminase large subunit [Lachnospiraceae bacterium]NBJ03667.1 PBSX family phage terminase large subunit [Lachnospiraceae bacterium]